MQRRNQNKAHSSQQVRTKEKIILGVTGSFGSGKTTVARIFKAFGAEIIDADRLAHSCVQTGNSCYKRIIDIFGKGILGRDKLIDRKKLARIVFDNKSLLIRLNKIIHPEVIRIIKNKIKNSKSKMIVLDAPLLVEAGLEKIVDKLIVVKITRDKQIKRIKKRTSLAPLAILKRIRYQIPLRVKARLADFVIDNSGSIEETRKQVERIRRLLWKS